MPTNNYSDNTAISFYSMLKNINEKEHSLSVIDWAGKSDAKTKPLISEMACHARGGDKNIHKATFGKSIISD